MIDVIAQAMAELADRDNWEAVARLQQLITDPGKLSLLTGADVSAFMEWKPGQSATGEAGWVSEGGQFRKEKPQGTHDTEESKNPKADHAAEVFAAGALDHLPLAIKTNPGIMGRLKEKALDAAAHVYGKLVTATPLLHNALNLLMDVTDDPRTDFNKLGYQPSLGGGGHETNDPVRGQLGISSHLASTIASKVLGTALYHFRKKVLGHFKGADDTDWIPQAAREMADLYASTLAQFGITAPVDPAPIEALLRKRQGATNAGKMADGPTVPPQVVKINSKPATGEVALAGQDGAAFAKLLGQSKAFGVRTMAEIVGAAIKRFKGRGSLLTEPEVRKLADALAAVNATADLLGRTRVREKADRAIVWQGKDAPPDAPFSQFADGAPGILATPDAAVDYFMSLRPELGIDPKRYGDMQRRQAFTLAVSANKFLTGRVQDLVGGALKKNATDAEANAAIRAALNGAGVTPKNPQYAEMVFRTNAMDSFQQGMYEEGRHQDVEDAFPVWRYLIVDDERTGDDHRPKGGKYYPRSASFSEVRGPRPYNCRCSMQWIDKFDWKQLHQHGTEQEENW